MEIDCITNPDLLSFDITNACNMAGSWWRKPLTGWGDINKKANEDDLLMSTLAINGGMNGLSHRYKYTQKALLTLGCNSCVNYESLNLGEYSFETSKIKMSSYCYEYDKYKNPIGPKNDKVNFVKNELKKAKKAYEK